MESPHVVFYKVDGVAGGRVWVRIGRGSAAASGAVGIIRGKPGAARGALAARLISVNPPGYGRGRRAARSVVLA